MLIQLVVLSSHLRPSSRFRGRHDRDRSGFEKAEEEFAYAAHLLERTDRRRPGNGTAKTGARGSAIFMTE